MSGLTISTKCSICRNSLSYFPIHQTIDDEVICGRCPLPTDKHTFRIKLYEVLAQQMSFACRFVSDGCPEKNQPDKVPDHENNCFYRRIKCPVASFTSCLWEGSTPQMLSHSESTHPDCFLEDNSFELNLRRTREFHYLSKCQTEMFVVRCRFDHSSQVLWCSLLFCGREYDAHKYVCTIVVEHDMRTLSVTVPHVKSFVRETKIDLFSLKKDSTYSVIVKLQVADVTASPKHTISVDRILSLLRCTLCSTYMRPPIYLSLNGHSICQNCHRAINLGSTCDRIMMNTQNFALQNVLSLPINRCRFAGCDFVSAHQQIESHEMYCLFSDVIEPCPLIGPQTTCAWYNPRKGVVKHMIGVHKNVFSDSNSIEVAGKDLASDKCHIFILKHSGRLFKINLECNGSHASCLADILNGSEGDKEKFTYDISIVRDNNLVWQNLDLNLGTYHMVQIPLHLLICVAHDNVICKIQVTKII